MKNNIKWNKEADVIIVGGGGAGFAAAIEAGRTGASVLILEKAGFCGGDTLASEGMMMAGGTKYQKAVGIKDSKENFTKTELSYLGQDGNPAMVKEMTEAANDELKFMVNQGRKYPDFDMMPPIWSYENKDTWAIRTHMDKSDTTGHFLALKKTVDNLKNVSYQVNTDVKHLLTDEAGTVIGVVDKKENKYRANKGVILATCSFCNNKQMLKQYNPMGYWALKYQEVYGNIATVGQDLSNTGEGIKMAQEIGASLQLSQADCMSDAAFSGGWVQEANKILVNRYGKRFVQENAGWGYFDSRVFQEARATGDTDPAKCKIYYICDSHTAENNLYVDGLLNDKGYSIKKGEAHRLIIQAESLDELAKKAGLPADNLKATVKRWNYFCNQGKDSDFQRANVQNQHDMQKIKDGPFFAIRYFPLMCGSFGGLKTNIECEVLDANDQVIPRLYAAGAIMSGMYTGWFYPACGWSLLGTIHWGRKAGRNAAQIRPWTYKKINISRNKEKRTDIISAASQKIKKPSYNFKAGSYSAESNGKNGPLKVTIQVSDHQIEKVKVGKNKETAGISDNPITEIPQQILEKQTPNVDVISGATMTSKGIINAVKKALKEAKK